MNSLFRAGFACVLVLAASCSDSKSSGSKPASDSTQIGSKGGVVTEGDASVDVPAGALPSAKTIVVAPSEVDVAPPEGYVLAGPPIAFTPHGLTFDVPVTLTLPYTATSAPLTVLRLEDEQDTTWEVIDGGKFSKGLATLDVSTFSIYAVAAESPPVDGTTGAGGVSEGGSSSVAGTAGASESGGANDTAGAASTGGDGAVRYSCDRTDNQSGLRICMDYFFPASIVKLAGGEVVPSCGPPGDTITVLGDACETSDAVIGCLTNDATGIPGVTTTSWFYTLDGFAGHVATAAELCSSDQEVINPP